MLYFAQGSVDTSLSENDLRESPDSVFEKLGEVKKSLEEPGVLRLEHRFAP